MKIATHPPKRRDAVRLMVTDPQTGKLIDRSIGDLPSFLRPNDLVVLNDAATFPASLFGTTTRGEAIEIRLLHPILSPDTLHSGSSSTPSSIMWRAVLFGEGNWQQRTEDRPAPPLLKLGDKLTFGSNHFSSTVEGYSQLSKRLLDLKFNLSSDAFWEALYQHAHPVQYAYQREALDLWSVQTIYASRPWAAEMPSAGRAITWSTIQALQRKGIGVATLTHAAGLSSTGDPELDQALPLPERFDIPEETVRAIEKTKSNGGRILAIGTTVVRTLEGATLLGHGKLQAGPGTTSLKLDHDSPLKAVDGLLTGMHDPSESHFRLLEAFAPVNHLQEMLEFANNKNYRAHEFGDLALIWRRAKVDSQPYAA